MNNEQIIEKAKKALSDMNLLNPSFIEIKVHKKLIKELLTIDPKHENEYTIRFGNGELSFTKSAGITVVVDRKTHQLLYAINKSGYYEIPEHLK
jgi:hypothetical protein